MRIQRPTHLLSLKLKTVDQESLSLQVNAYSSKFRPLEYKHVKNDNIHHVDISIPIPDRIVIGFLGIDKQGLELLEMSLVGIPFIKSVLNKILEYKPTNQLKKVFDIPSITNTLHWSCDGYLVIDFFNPDPFAYHMYVGNKIRML